MHKGGQNNYWSSSPKKKKKKEKRCSIKRGTQVSGQGEWAQILLKTENWQKDPHSKMACYPLQWPRQVFFLRAAFFVIRLRGSLCGTID